MPGFHDGRHRRGPACRGQRHDGRRQNAADYTGKQVTIVIGYGVGGTYSQYGQLFSHHLGRFLPGKPNVIMQSMPGAGGVRMLNEAAVRMRAEGATIFVPPDTMVTTQLLETSGVAYDARKFHYIGTADQQNTFWVIRLPWLNTCC